VDDALARQHAMQKRIAFLPSTIITIGLMLGCAFMASDYAATSHWSWKATTLLTIIEAALALNIVYRWRAKRKLKR
jgi:hypothetical protein